MEHGLDGLIRINTDFICAFRAPRFRGCYSVVNFIFLTPSPRRLAGRPYIAVTFFFKPQLTNFNSKFLIEFVSRNS